MKDILDIVVWGGFIFILFIFLRGMNETQVEKHKTRLEEAENFKKKKENTEQGNKV